MPTDHELPDTHVHFKWDVGNEPALTIRSGDTVSLESRDVSDNQLGPSSTSKDIEGLDWDRVYPLAGPIAIADAKPIGHIPEDVDPAGLAGDRRIDEGERRVQAAVAVGRDEPQRRASEAAAGELDTGRWKSTRISYRVDVSSAAAPNELLRLLAVVDEVAEIVVQMRSRFSLLNP